MPKHCEYVQQIDKLKVPLESFDAIIKAHSIIREWAYIIHDKDTYTQKDVLQDSKLPDDVRKGIKEGDLKPAHVHVYLHFGNSCASFSVVAAWFGDSAQYVQKILGRKADMLKYLTHLNAPNKFQYNVDEVHTNMDITAQIEMSEEQDTLYACMEDVLLRFTTDVITYAQANKEMYVLKGKCKTQENIKYYLQMMDKIDKIWMHYCKVSAKGVRQMDVIFVYGNSGKGKSVFAKFLAETLCSTQNYRDYTESSADNDPLQDYMGEDILIMNDFRDVDSMTGKPQKLTNVLKLLDPHFMSSTESRFHNKTFTGKLILITSAKDPLTWFKDCKEQRWQFFRRISRLVEIQKNYIIEYAELNTSGLVPFWCGFSCDENNNNYITKAKIDKINVNMLADYIALDDKNKQDVTNITADMLTYLQAKADERGVKLSQDYVPIDLEEYTKKQITEELKNHTARMPTERESHLMDLYFKKKDV